MEEVGRRTMEAAANYSIFGAAETSAARKKTARGHFFRVPHKKPRWESARTRIVEPPYTELKPQRPTSSGPIPAKEKDPKFWWDLDQSSLAQNADGIIVIPEVSKSGEKVAERTKKKGSKRDKEPSSPSYLIGQPAMAPALTQQVLERGGTAAPFRKGWRIPLEHFDLQYTHPTSFPQPAESRHFLPNGKWVWRPCTVLDYNTDTKRFTIYWEDPEKVDTGNSFEVASLEGGFSPEPSPLASVRSEHFRNVLRINLRFKVEDPHMHAKVAMASLRQRELVIREVDFEDALHESAQHEAEKVLEEEYLPIWAWRAVPGMMGRLGNTIEKNENNEGLIDTLLTEQVQMHAWLETVHTGVALDKGPLNTHHETKHWFPGIAFKELTKNKVLEMCPVYTTLERDAGGWLVASPSLESLVRECYGVANHLGDMDLLMHATGVFELSRFIGAQMDVLFTGVLFYKDELDRLSKLAQQLADREPKVLFADELGMSPLHRVLRQCRMFVDSALVCTIHKSVQLYLDSFPCAKMTQKPQGRYSTFDSTRPTVLLPVALKWDKEKNKLIFVPPLDDFFQLGRSLIDETQETLWEIEALELEEGMLIKRGVEHREMMQIATKDQFQKARERVSTCLVTCCKMLTESVTLLHLHSPQHVSGDLSEKGLEYRRDVSLQEFSERVENCNKAFLNALFALREENVFGVFRLEVDTVIEEFESVTKTLREEAFKSLLIAWEADVTKLEGELFIHQQLEWHDIEHIKPTAFYDLHTFIQGFESTEATLTWQANECESMLAVLQRGYIELPQETLHRHFTSLMNLYNLRELVKKTSPLLAGRERAVQEALRNEQVELKERLENDLLKVDFEQYAQLCPPGVIAEDADQHAYQLAEALDSLTSTAHQLEENIRQQAVVGLEADEDMHDVLDLLADAFSAIEPLSRLWAVASEWNAAAMHWSVTVFRSKLNMRQLTKQVYTLASKVASLKRLSNAEHENNGDDYIIAKEGPRNMLNTLSSHLTILQELMPLIHKLHHPRVRARHWRQLFALFESVKDKGPATTLGLTEHGIEHASEHNLSTFTLPGLLMLPLDKAQEEAMAILYEAIHEYELEISLLKMNEELRGMTYRVHIQPSGSKAIQGVQDMLEVAEDQLLSLDKLLSRPYYSDLEVSARRWQGTLKTVIGTMYSILDVQRQFLTLWPTFHNGDAQQSLVESTRIFMSVERHWDFMVDMVALGMPAMMVCENTQVNAGLHQCSLLMDKVSHTVLDYFYSKRYMFPRFFFLSNDELTEVLGSLDDLSNVQALLCKCFSRDIQEVNIRASLVQGLRSRQGEVMPFIQPVALKGAPVDECLNTIIDRMRTSVQIQLTDCLIKSFSGWWGSWAASTMAAFSYKPRNTMSIAGSNVDLFKHLGPDVCKKITSLGRMLDAETDDVNQTVLLAHQAMFTMCAEQALGQIKTVQKMSKEIGYQLSALSASLHLKSNLLSKLKRCFLSVLTVQTVYHRDVFSKLLDLRVATAEDLEWKRCPRFYPERINEPPQPPNRNIALALNAKTLAMTRHTCVLKMLDTSTRYDCEYIGSSTRLVMTPLTERCYLAMAHHLSEHRSSALLGSSGSGKTEIAKDFANAAGKLHIAVNCSGMTDLESIGNLFRGVASSGAWGILDGAHQMQPTMLKVMSRLALSVLEARAMNNGDLVLDGKSLRLDNSFALFATIATGPGMSVSSLDDLKLIYRTITLAQPDIEFICKVLLHAQGIENTEVLSRKLAACFEHLANVLFRCDHYVFGLHNMKICIQLTGKRVLQASARTPALYGGGEGQRISRMAGRASEPVAGTVEHLWVEEATKVRRASHHRSASEADVVALAVDSTSDSANADAANTILTREEEIRDVELLALYRAMRSCILPMMRDGRGDALLFEELLRDMFPGTKPPKSSFDNQLRTALVAALKQRKLKDDMPELVSKCLELHSALEVQRGVLLLGPPGTGKSTCYQTLAVAIQAIATQARSATKEEFVADKYPALVRQLLEDSEYRLSISVVNPKAISLGKLFGEYATAKNSEASSVWNDGVVSVILRKYSSNSPQAPSWLVMDGNITSDWVDQLNSVLDGTGEFYLSSGERLRLPALGHFKMLFEATDLTCASPCMVTRCSVVCLESAKIGWWPLVQSKLSDLPEIYSDHEDLLNQLYDNTFRKGLRMVKKECALMTQSELNLAQSHLHLMNAMLSLWSTEKPPALMAESVDRQNSKLRTTSWVPEMDAGGTKDDQVQAEDAKQTSNREATYALMRDLGLADLLSEENESGDSISKKKTVSPAAQCLSGKALEGMKDSMLQSILDHNRMFQLASSSTDAPFAATSSEDQQDPSKILKAKLNPTSATRISTKSVTKDERRKSRRMSRSNSFAKEFRRSMTMGKMGSDAVDNDDDVDEEDMEDLWFRRVFLFALVWSLGANLNPTDCQRFDNWILEQCQASTPYSRYLGKALPDVFTSMYDMALDASAHTWIRWQHFMPSPHQRVDRLEQMLDGAENVSKFALSSPDARIPISQIWIPTVDAVARSRIIQMMTIMACPVVLIGPVSSGKTVTMREVLANIKQSGIIPLELGLTSKSTAVRFVGRISHHLEKRENQVLGPRNKLKMALFVDDLSRPSPDAKSHVSELMRFLIEQHGWYSLEQPLYHTVEDVHLLAASHASNMSSSSMSQRFLRHFLVIHLSEYEHSTLTVITQAILAARFSATSAEHLSLWRGLERIDQTILNMYSAMVEHFLPTPAQPHYQFNIRHYFQILQGVLYADPAEVFNMDSLPKVLVHETMRTMGDRLGNVEDRRWMTESLTKIAGQYFDFHLSAESAASLHFGNYEVGNLDSYSQVTDWNHWAQYMNEVAGDFAETDQQKSTQQFRVVLFAEACSHLLRMLRVLRASQGHLMILGEKATGRKTIAKLAAYIAGMDVYEGHGPTREHSKEEVDEVLKSVHELFWHMMKSAAFGDTHIMFLLNMEDLTFSHGQSLLEDLNLLLLGDEIPGLFTERLRQQVGDRMKELFIQRANEQKGPSVRTKGRVKPQLLDDGTEGKVPISQQMEAVGMHITREASFRSSDPLHNGFVTLMQSKLHVVIVAESSDREALRQCLEAYPALNYCCTIDWFDRWPKSAFKAVAYAYMSTWNSMLLPEQVQKIVSTCAQMHIITRNSILYVQLPDSALPDHTHDTSYDNAMPSSKATIIHLHTESAELTHEQVAMELYAVSSPPKTAISIAMARSATSLFAFISLVAAFKKLFDFKREHLMQTLEQIEVACQRISSMTMEVFRMQQERNAANTKFRLMNEEAVTITEDIASATTLLQRSQEDLDEQQSIVDTHAAAVRAHAEDAKAVLNRAMPELLQAEQQLVGLSKYDIDEMKKHKSPPQSLMMLMETLCIMLGRQPERVDVSKMFTKEFPFQPPLQEAPQTEVAQENFDENSTEPKVIKGRRISSKHKQSSHPKHKRLSKKAQSENPRDKADGEHTLPEEDEVEAAAQEAAKDCKEVPIAHLDPEKNYDLDSLVASEDALEIQAEQDAPEDADTQDNMLDKDLTDQNEWLDMVNQRVQQKGWHLPANVTPDLPEFPDFHDNNGVPERESPLPGEPVSNAYVRMVRVNPKATQNKAARTKLPSRILVTGGQSTSLEDAVESLHQITPTVTPLRPVPILDVPSSAPQEPPPCSEEAPLKSVQDSSPATSPKTKPERRASIADKLKTLAIPTAYTATSLLDQTDEQLDPTDEQEENDVEIEYADDYSQAATELLNDDRFIQMLIDFDHAEVPQHRVRKLDRYINDANFTLAALDEVSDACRCLGAWVHGAHQFHEVTKEAVAPLRAKLEEAKFQLLASKSALHDNRIKVNNHELRLVELLGRQEVLSKELELQQQVVLQYKDHTVQTEIVIRVLEKLRIVWTDKVPVLKERLKWVMGDAFIAAWHIAYGGWFNPIQRAKAMSFWKCFIANSELPVSKDFGFKDFFPDQVSLHYHLAAGLPATLHAAENVLITENSIRWPLLFDPQQQARKWLCNIVDRDFRDKTQETLNIAEFSLKSKYPSYMECRTDESFQSLAKSVHSAMETGHVLLMQLVGGSNEYAIKEERTLSMGSSLNAYQSKILMMCEQTAGSILSEPLIFTFARRILDIEEQIVKVEESKRLTVTAETSLYEDLAARLIMMYVVMQQLAEIYPVYHCCFNFPDNALRRLNLVLLPATYSFQTFKLVCSMSIQRVDARNPQSPPPAPPRECSTLEEREQYAHFVYVKVSNTVLKQLARSLLERHRTLFGFSVVVFGMRREGSISEAEWRVFVTMNSDSKIPVAVNEHQLVHEHQLVPETPNPLAQDPASEKFSSTWIVSTVWKRLEALCSAVPHLAELISQNAPNGLQQADSEWRSWAEAKDPFQNQLPGAWDALIKPCSFQRILLMHCFQTLLAPRTIYRFVTRWLGYQINERDPSFELSQVAPQASSLIPLLIVHDEKVSPAEDISAYARLNNMARNMQFVSLGTDHNARLGGIVQTASEQGTWIVLLNCHRGSNDVFHELSAVLRSIENHAHKSFRLWICLQLQIRECTLPTHLLDLSVHTTIEPPTDIPSLLRFAGDQLKANKMTSIHPLLLHLYLLHYMLVGRAKFEPSAWLQLEQTHPHVTREELYTRGALPDWIDQAASFPTRPLMSNQPYVFTQSDFRYATSCVLRLAKQESRMDGLEKVIAAEVQGNTAESVHLKAAVQAKSKAKPQASDPVLLRKELVKRIKNELVEVVYGPCIHRDEPRQILQEYTNQAFCLDKSIAGYPGAFASNTNVVAERAIRAYFGENAALPPGAPELDNPAAWGPSGLQLSVFHNHLKSASLQRFHDNSLELYGLHHNIRIMHQQTEMSMFLQDLSMIEKNTSQERDIPNTTLDHASIPVLSTTPCSPTSHERPSDSQLKDSVAADPFDFEQESDDDNLPGIAISPANFLKPKAPPNSAMHPSRVNFQLPMLARIAKLAVTARRTSTSARSPRVTEFKEALKLKQNEQRRASLLTLIADVEAVLPSTLETRRLVRAHKEMLQDYKKVLKQAVHGGDNADISSGEESDEESDSEAPQIPIPKKSASRAFIGLPSLGEENAPKQKRPSQDLLRFNAAATTIIRRRHSDFLQSGSASSLFQQVANNALSLERLAKTLPTPMALVLQQECMFYNRLLASVHASLSELRQGLQGDEQHMSPAMEALAQSLLLCEVPQRWLLFGLVSHLQLGSWLSHLVEATEFFKEWLALHERQSFPPVMHLPAFSAPLRVISAVVQEYSRTHHSPMDTITSYSYTVPRQEWNGEPAKIGCFMDGLWIENACVDDQNRKLTECRPNEKWSPMSMLLFQAVPKLSIDHKDKLQPLGLNSRNSDQYTCPIYRTSPREGESMESRTSNFITTMQLDPGDHRVEHWVVRGVRIACTVLDTEYQ